MTTQETSNSLSTIREFSVTEISNVIKDLLEVNLGTIKINGEISGLKVASSGHAYFNLKENLSVIACTCWRPILAKLKVNIAEGMEIVATGKVTAYGGQSKYQLSIEKIESAGLGLWMQILRDRQEKLEKEGLFLESRKKPINFIPKRIGVITSITGSVIKDIIHRIIDRFPTHIIIWSVAVQGETSALEVSNAIEGFNTITDARRPDLIIIARGGGSIEDLWSFNEEIVVRSIASSNIPIISAIGHETDYTLADLAADKRSPTPTAAAEIAVPVLSDLRYTISLHYSRHLSNIIQFLKYRQAMVSSYENNLRQPIYHINFRQQKTDEYGFRLLEAFPSLLKAKLNLIKQCNIEKSQITQRINYAKLQLDNLYQSLLNNLALFLNLNAHKLSLHGNLLLSLDYNKTLLRGFTIVRNENNQIVSSYKKSLTTQSLKIKFHDGELTVYNYEK